MRYSRAWARTSQALALMAICWAGACRTGAPVMDAGEKPSSVDGTVAGIVSGPDGTSPIVGRTITLIEVSTAQRLTTKTAANGGYTFKVPPGTYRFELELLPGEVIVKGPDQTTINSSDLDAGRDFVVSQSPTKPPGTR